MTRNKTLLRTCAAAIAACGILLSSASAALANDRWGGPTYGGAPDLALTSSLIAAGGGAAHWSAVKALDAMVGPTLVNAEVAKLSRQYGKATVNAWVSAFDLAVADALKDATAAGVSLPKPTLSGKALAVALVKAGTTSDGTFWIGYLYDHLLTHKIHDQVMDQVERNSPYGVKGDGMLHAVSNQAFYDLAHALGATQIKLASYHTVSAPVAGGSAY